MSWDTEGAAAPRRLVPRGGMAVWDGGAQVRGSSYAKVARIELCEVHALRANVKLSGRYPQRLRAA